MKKILLVFGSLERAGAQLRTLAICREIRKRYPVHFDFCTLELGPNQLESDIKGIQANVFSLPIRTPRFIHDFTDLLKKERYCVVHSMPLLLSGVIVYLARLQKIPIRIAHLRSSLSDANAEMVSPLFIWIMRKLINSSATHIAAVSRAAMDSVIPQTWQSTANCQVVYNGLLLSDFQRSSEKTEVCQEFGWPINSQIVINVGRFSPPKNHRTILETFRLVKDKTENIRFLLVGDGALRNELMNLIHRLDLNSLCVIAGLRTDIPRLLSASDVFFFPSLWEGLPGALLEALGAGLPIVASSIPAIREIKQYFPVSMYLADPMDIEKHAEHILTALTMPLDRSHMQTCFSKTPFVLDNTVNAFVGMYGLI